MPPGPRAAPRATTAQQRHLRAVPPAGSRAARTRHGSHGGTLNLAVADDDWMRCMLDKGAHAGIAVAHRAACAASSPRHGEPARRRHSRNSTTSARTAATAGARDVPRSPRRPSLGVRRRAERQHEPRQKQRQWAPGAVQLFCRQVHRWSHSRCSPPAMPAGTVQLSRK